MLSRQKFLQIPQSTELLKNIYPAFPWARLKQHGEGESFKRAHTHTHKPTPPNIMSILSRAGGAPPMKWQHSST